MKWRGDVMRQYRKINKMTQSELADKLGTFQQLIARWEGGDRPNFESISKIAEVLNASEAELLDIDLDADSYKSGFRAGAAFIINKMCKDVDKALLGRW